jgi:hypothetical protein
MNYHIHSYRFAKEIIEHSTYNDALIEILAVVKQCPLFRYPNKSKSNKRLDLVQQLFNTYFDRAFSFDLEWQYHPTATTIPDSGLTADYKKTFGNLRIQAEVQFGNMARWYSDIFKFQTAYSQNLIDFGLSIVPMSSVGVRIDSNIANFERCVRELPSAKLSVTLPILIIGLYADENTPVVNVAQTNLGGLQNITKAGKVQNRYRIVNGFLVGTPMDQINETSDTGPMASLFDTEDPEQ